MTVAGRECLGRHPAVEQRQTGLAAAGGIGADGNVGVGVWIPAFAGMTVGSGDDAVAGNDDTGGMTAAAGDGDAVG